MTRLTMALVLTAVVLAVGCGGKDQGGEPAADRAVADEPAAAGESIGSAKMKPDGTIVLQLRAEGPGGMIGDALVMYKPGDPKYQETLDHLGGLEPGQEKPVPPWPEEPTAPQQAKPAPWTEAPSDSDSFAITAAQSRAVGLPAIGFKLSGLNGHGWTRFAADRNHYLALSGPPGGPLSFRVTPYSDGVSDPPTLEALFRAAVEDHTGLDPIVSGQPEKVAVAGREREAQAFRTGRSLATSNWCAVKIPAQKIERTGLLLTLRVGTSEDRPPACALCLSHPALEPLAESFELEQ